MALAESPGFESEDGENELIKQLDGEAVETEQESVGKVGRAAVSKAFQETSEAHDAARQAQDLLQEVTPPPRRRNVKRRSARQTTSQGPREDPVRQYLDEIGRHPLLTKDDEVRLARDIEVGKVAAERLKKPSWHHLPREKSIYAHEVEEGEEAYTTFVQANLRLVVSIAKRYHGSDLPLPDLIQEGNLGLMHAVEKFDHRKGFKFSTYATWWIRQNIVRGIANTADNIRIPINARGDMNKIRKALNELTDQMLPAGIPELAAKTGLSTNKVTELLQYIDPMLSLSEPISSDTDTELGDLIPDVSDKSPESSVLGMFLPKVIEKILECLDGREREVIRLRYGVSGRDKTTLEEVGQKYNLSRERIRQIEKKALAKLGDSVDRNLLQD